MLTFKDYAVITLQLVGTLAVVLGGAALIMWPVVVAFLSAYPNG